MRKLRERLRRAWTCRRPEEVMVEVTMRCNLDCAFCFNKLYALPGGDPPELSTEAMRRIIRAVKRAGVPRIRFTGGEPLLREDMPELMAYAQQQRLSVWLNTNATLMTAERAKYIVETVDNILIPLNSWDAAGEYVGTGRRMFKNKLRGIRLLQKYGARIVRCGTVATRENIACLERIHDLVQKLQVSEWELFRPIPVSQQDRPISNQDVALLVEKLLTINRSHSKKYRIANAVPFCAYDPRKVEQVALGAIADDGHVRFVVDSRGRGKPMYYLNEDLGNALSESLLRLWHKPFMRQMRNLGLAPAGCRVCEFLEKCRGGSRIASRVVGGDYRALDYLARSGQMLDC